MSLMACRVCGSKFSLFQNDTSPFLEHLKSAHPNESVVGFGSSDGSDDEEEKKKAALEQKKQEGEEKKKKKLEDKKKKQDSRKSSKEFDTNNKKIVGKGCQCSKVAELEKKLARLSASGVGDYPCAKNKKQSFAEPISDAQMGDAEKTEKPNEGDQPGKNGRKKSSMADTPGDGDDKQRKSSVANSERKNSKKDSIKPGESDATKRKISVADSNRKGSKKDSIIPETSDSTKKKSSISDGNRKGSKKDSIQIEESEATGRKSSATDGKRKGSKKDSIIPEESDAAGRKNSDADGKGKGSKKDSIVTEGSDATKRKSSIADSNRKGSKKDSIIPEKSDSTEKKISVSDGSGKCNNKDCFIPEESDATKNKSCVSDGNGKCSKKECIKLEESDATRRKSSVSDDKRKGSKKDSINPEKSEDTTRKSSLSDDNRENKSEETDGTSDNDKKKKSSDSQKKKSSAKEKKKGNKKKSTDDDWKKNFSESTTNLITPRSETTNEDDNGKISSVAPTNDTNVIVGYVQTSFGGRGDKPSNPIFRKGYFKESDYFCGKNNPNQLVTSNINCDKYIRGTDYSKYKELDVSKVINVKHKRKLKSLESGDTSSESQTTVDTSEKTDSSTSDERGGAKRKKREMLRKCWSSGSGSDTKKDKCNKANLRMKFTKDSKDKYGRWDEEDDGVSKRRNRRKAERKDTRRSKTAEPHILAKRVQTIEKLRTIDEFNQHQNNKTKTSNTKLYRTTVETWWHGYEKISCPKCGTKETPVVRRSENKLTRSIFGACCMLSCWPLVFLPFQMCSSGSEQNLYCMKCDEYLGTLKKDGVTYYRKTSPKVSESSMTS